MQRLVQKGADLNTGDHEGLTALAHACASGTANVVRLLLQSGSKVNVVSTYVSYDVFSSCRMKIPFLVENYISIFIGLYRMISPKVLGRMIFFVYCDAE